MAARRPDALPISELEPAPPRWSVGGGVAGRPKGPPFLQPHSSAPLEDLPLELRRFLAGSLGGCALGEFDPARQPCTRRSPWSRQDAGRRLEQGTPGHPQTSFVKMEGRGFFCWRTHWEVAFVAVLVGFTSVCLVNPPTTLQMRKQAQGG